MKEIKDFNGTRQFVTTNESSYIAHSYIIEDGLVLGVVCGEGNFEHSWESLEQYSKESLKKWFDKNDISIKNT